MGRQRKRNYKSKRKDQSSELNVDNQRSEDARDNRGPRWGPLPTQNRIMREYYQAQKIENTPEGFQEFWKVMGVPLPSTLRLHAKGRSADVLRQRLTGDLQEGYPVIVADEEKKKRIVHDVIDPPQAISWYPGDNAWRLGGNKMTIRKVEALGKLKAFLLSESDAGTIIRQEEASMIPPFFLEVKPHHIVLDMCAAPGSKTTQLLEALHCDDIKNNFKPPSGMVFANDVNVKRAYMLVNRLKNHASPNLIITAHDASSFPNPLNIEKGCSRPRAKKGFFDRILADVPCSGDGTLRKAPDIFRSFDTNNGNTLHVVQLSIARRGLKLLKVGGLMVYSTCSLNPVENEAVIAELLRQHPGCLEIVDTSSMLPKLKRRKGLSSWKCALMLDSSKYYVENEKKIDSEVVVAESADKGHDGDNLSDTIEGCPENMVLQLFSSYDEYDAFKTRELEYCTTNSKSKTNRYIPSTAFPPTESEAESMNLERCMRVMPHDQNTSGFFVCLLRKTGEIAKSSSQSLENAEASESKSDPEKLPTKSIAESSETAERLDDTETNASNGNSFEPILSTGLRDDDYVPIPTVLWNDIRTMLKFEDESLAKQFFFRAGDGSELTRRQKSRRLEHMNAVSRGDSSPRSLTFVSLEVGNVLQTNNAQKLHVVGAGVSMLKKNQQVNGDNNQYRVAQDGIQWMLPTVNARISNKMSTEDLVLILHFAGFTSDDPSMKHVESKWPGVPLKALSQSLQNSLTDIGHRGGVILSLEKDAQTNFIECMGYPCILSMWLGAETLSAMVCKANLQLMSDKLLMCGFLDQESFTNKESPDEIRRRHLPDSYMRKTEVKSE